MPCREDIAIMCAVAGVAAPVEVIAINTVPGYEGAAVDS